MLRLINNACCVKFCFFIWKFEIQKLLVLLTFISVVSCGNLMAGFRAFFISDLGSWASNIHQGKSCIHFLVYCESARLLRCNLYYYDFEWFLRHLFGFIKQCQEYVDINRGNGGIRNNLFLSDHYLQTTLSIFIAIIHRSETTGNQITITNGTFATLSFDKIYFFPLHLVLRKSGILPWLEIEVPIHAENLNWSHNVTSDLPANWSRNFLKFFVTQVARVSYLTSNPTSYSQLLTPLHKFD